MTSNSERRSESPACDDRARGRSTRATESATRIAAALVARAKADGNGNRATPGAPGRKQQSEADEREAERGVTGDERAISVAFRGGQRGRREAVWSAKCLDLDRPRASPMIL